MQAWLAGFVETSPQGSAQVNPHIYALQSQDSENWLDSVSWFGSNFGPFLSALVAGV